MSDPVVFEISENVEQKSRYFPVLYFMNIGINVASDFLYLV